MEIKWDIKRGAEVYRAIYNPRLQRWISTGKIKSGDVLVWRSGFSGWRKPEELEEFKHYFKEQARKCQQLEEAKELPKEQITAPRKQIKNILIIDDEKDMCFLLSDTLNRRKYNVTVANTKKDGIACFKKELPDLVLLDLKLPDGDGINVLSKIKKIKPDTIVVVVTAYGSEEIKEKARQKGAYDFINKPFAEKEINKIIRQFSGQRGANGNYSYSR